MPNRDHEDSQYNRHEGRFESRGDPGYRESGRGSLEWHRDPHAVDEWRSEPEGRYRAEEHQGYPYEQRGYQGYGAVNRGRGEPFARDPERGFGQRSFGPRYGVSHGGDRRDAQSWFDQRREAQHFDVQRSASQPSYGRNWGYEQHAEGASTAAIEGPTPATHRAATAGAISIRRSASSVRKSATSTTAIANPARASASSCGMRGSRWPTA